MDLADDYPIEFSYSRCEKCEQIIRLVWKRARGEQYTTKADLQEAFTKHRGNIGKRSSIETHLRELQDLKLIKIDNLIEIIGYKEGGGKFTTSFYDSKLKGIQNNVPEEITGTIQGYYNSLATGLTFLSAPITGILVQFTGYHNTFFLISTFSLAIILIIIWRRTITHVHRN